MIRLESGLVLMKSGQIGQISSIFVAGCKPFSSNIRA